MAAGANQLRKTRVNGFIAMAPAYKQRVVGRIFLVLNTLYEA